MDTRFSRLFNLTETQAIEILDAPANDSDEASNRYIAASHLVNFDSAEAIAALIRAVKNDDDDLDNRIVRRKALEALGRLKVAAAVPVIDDALTDEDNYLVENAAWALGEIGTDDTAILEKLAEQLDRPDQSYRTLIHALATLNYKPAVERIKVFTTSEQAPIASAALTAIYRLTDDEAVIPQVLQFLQSHNVNARRGSIQDLMDANYSAAIPPIAQCPVSSVFRLRAIRQLAELAIKTGKLTFADVQPHLENVLRDHPDTVALVHAYDRELTVPELVQALYGTDFGRCYLASKTLIDHHAKTAPAELLARYEAEGYNDYGAHYHIMRMFGWLQMSEGYDLLIEALNNKAPQFQKSRTAAAIALGELGSTQAIPPLTAALSVPIWDLQYAALMSLSKLGESNLDQHFDSDKTDWLIQEKLNSL
ncbi:MAG: phycocyanin operon protein Y [Leptolyngbya foveolarum]|uniref:Phycocyanin operon protein Y n=1 Tax=Leptolyngbya foveolarum TaxID=47253 RepID=A0A2W4TYG8_9CYAN|nr:MAG: phycocyanin operon protein Y [Leptolyngbya foveolarum]